MQISREQAEAFLRSLWPEGSMNYIHNPTRTYFDALLGTVPQAIAWTENEATAAACHRLADTLRSIASHIDTVGDAT